jgi:hypothetical protein
MAILNGGECRRRLGRVSRVDAIPGGSLQHRTKRGRKSREIKRSRVHDKKTLFHLVVCNFNSMP